MNNSKKRSSPKVWVYIVFAILFILFFAFVFKWQNQLHWHDAKYVIDNELLGTYGEFVGGVLGTIFALVSIVFLIRTFTEQRVVTEKNEEQIENQRFNDLFFELLRLYQSETSELCTFGGEGHAITKYTNKDFFDYEKEILQRAFRPTTSYEKNREEALKWFMLFYIKHRTKMSACFRTLYRIYDLLDRSKLDGSIKKDYLKIIRAQLTDSELFFIRYNGMTYYGNNFIRYINKYNVLKHLPAFDLLEFKDWWVDLNPVERMGINIVFHNSTRFLRRILLNGRNWSFKMYDDDSMYKFEIKTKSNYDVEIKLQIDTSKENKIMEYAGLNKFDHKRIQALLDCYLKETFLFSNFKEFNTAKDIEFYSNPIITNKTIVIINSGVRNTKRVALKIKADLANSES